MALAGHCVRHTELTASQLILWEPTEGRRKRDRRRTTLIGNLKGMLGSVPRLSLVRFCSSETTLIRVSNNLELRTRQNANRNDSTTKKPLVLIFAWMSAQRRHMQKFEKIYLERGCDVMTITIRLPQLLLPKTGSQVIAEKVVDFLHQPQNGRRPLLVHAFCIGGYLYSETLLKSLGTSSGEGDMKDRIVGQIFDSIADLNEIPDGLSTVLFKSPLLRAILRTMIKTYRAAFYKPVTSNYIRAYELFHHNPVPSPVLFLYSKLDEFGSAAVSGEIAKKMIKKGGRSVYFKCWDDSPHVQHLRKYPIEYVEIIDSFLSQLPPFAGKGDSAVRDNGKLTAFKARL
ncbi:transmembrane protein 53-like [Branchiostoma lanceolatum]|uniref:transmembrane protein 53-like n=1 Tax=Branchiostoma lanceolatum TaxID=7740 RepID=UPI0034539772